MKTAMSVGTQNRVKEWSVIVLVNSEKVLKIGACYKDRKMKDDLEYMNFSFKFQKGISHYYFICFR